MILEIIILVLAFGLIGLIFVYTLISGSPPTPTSGRVRGAMLRLLPRHLPLSEIHLIYDLGSGWGGVAPSLSHLYPNHYVVGIERSPIPWVVSRLSAALRGWTNVSFELGDFMQRDLSDASLVVCYLAGTQMEKLGLKLETELKPGALVLTHTFAIPSWRPVDLIRADDIYRSPVYLYEISATSKGCVASVSQAATEASSSPDS